MTDYTVNRGEQITVAERCSHCGKELKAWEDGFCRACVKEYLIKSLGIKTVKQ
jgi:predicted amidophosphoribosyltransferase